jgi:hypothetical protein
MDMVTSPGKPVVLSTRKFSTQEEANSFFRAMRERYSVDERIQGADVEDLAALFRRHPEYQQKVGIGIDHFIAAVDQGPGYRSKCFAVVRTDGTSEKFSYRACVTQKIRPRDGNSD